MINDKYWQDCIYNQWATATQLVMQFNWLAVFFFFFTKNTYINNILP